MAAHASSSFLEAARTLESFDLKQWIGTAEVMPIGTRLPKVRRVGIVFGEALDFSRFHGMEGDRFVLRSVTDELVYDLRALSEQRYVDVYASTVREQRAPQSR